MVYFSKWLKDDFPELYSQLRCVLAKHGEECDLLPNTKDYWCRDYMPIALGRGRFLQYDYMPDYLNNKRDRRYITDPCKVCESLGLECVKADIVLDGGNVVRCGDKVVMIDKIFSENPQYDRVELLSELERLLEAQIVLLPWDRKEKYGHADGVVRYIGDGKVLLTNYRDYDANVHSCFKDILSKNFEVRELCYSQSNSNDSSWAYINFLQTEWVIIVPMLGSHKDQEALEQIRRYFPQYKGRIEQVDAREIVRRGGALNCVSWEY